MKSIRCLSLIPVFGILLFFTSACTDQSKADSVAKNEENASKSKDKVAKVEFSCIEAQNNGEDVFATVVNNDLRDEPLTVIYWNLDNDYFGEQWTPKKRCEIVSQRFQTIHNRNGIKFITTDVAHWLGDSKTNIICGVETKEAQCKEEDLLLTLQSDDDPDEVLQEIIALRDEPEISKPTTRGGTAKERVIYNLEKELKPKTPSF